MKKDKDVQEALDSRVSSIMALLQQHDLDKGIANNSVVIDADLTIAINQLNGAEAAYLLEMLPVDQRTLVWSNLKNKIASDALCEIVEDAAEYLIKNTSDEKLDEILLTMEADDLADISELLSSRSIEVAKNSLSTNDQHWLEITQGYADNSVGSLMSVGYLLFDGNLTVKEATNKVRLLTHLPNQSDKLFIINGRNQLEGVVTLIQLLRHNENDQLVNIMDGNPIVFEPEKEAKEAGLAFERYDLISAPVVNENREVIGRLTVESIMDYIREKAEQTALAKEGLDVDSDLFGPIWISAKKRWLWLSINLITAFIASRFIGLFEDSITTLVALATLMPIVASVGGNTGNQTIALLVRGLSLRQIRKENLRFLFVKELSISLINGLMWGAVLGAFAYVLYGNALLALVLMVATMLNLLVAAFIGMVVPIGLDKLGKDPAMGSSVILTFITDSMGFFIFLSLATAFLI